MSSTRSFDPFPADRLPKGWRLDDSPPSQWDIDHGILPVPAIIGPEKYNDLSMIAYDDETCRYFFPGHSQTRGHSFATFGEAIAWLKGLEVSDGA